jgi:hypothetical protein
MAESAVTVAVEPDLSGNDEQGRRLALRADHGYTSGKSKTSILQVQQSRGKINSNIIRGSFSTAPVKKANYLRQFMIFSTNDFDPMNYSLSK